MRYRTKICYTYKITSSQSKEKFIIPPETSERRVEFFSPTLKIHNYRILI